MPSPNLRRVLPWRSCPAAGRGGAAATTWIFRGGGRRGNFCETASRDGAAAAAWIFRGGGRRGISARPQILHVRVAPVVRAGPEPRCVHDVLRARLGRVMEEPGRRVAAPTDRPRKLRRTFDHAPVVCVVRLLWVRLPAARAPATIVHAVVRLARRARGDGTADARTAHEAAAWRQREHAYYET